MKSVLPVVVALAVLGAAPSEDEKRSEQAEARVKALRGLLSDEIRQLGAHPWAGTYYEGDGLGVNVSLTLAPASGFVFEWHGCLGLYDRNWGPLSAAGDRVRLLPELPNTREGFQGIPVELLPVRWGRRHYLIATDRVLDFCNAVNGRSEPREGVHGLFLLRKGDESRKVAGRPELPREFEYCFLDAPIAARIVEVGSSALKPSLGTFEFRDTTVTLDAGSAHGVWEGMEFHLVSPKGRYETATVRRVGDRTSEAGIREMGTDAPPPAVGWRLSTRSPR